AGVNPAYRVVLGVYHDDVVLGVTAHGLGRTPGSRQRRATVAAIAPYRLCSGYSSQDTLGVHLPHAIAFPLTDVGVPQLVHAHGPRPHKAGLGGPLAIPGAGLLTSAGKGSDHTSAQVHPANALILNIGNQQAALAVQAHVVGFTQRGLGGGATIAAV